MTILLAATTTVTCILLLGGPLYLIYKPPAFLIRYFQRRWPDVLWHVSSTTNSSKPKTKTEPKTIALTIDDGPSEHTRAILELLAAHDAKATFFVIGSYIDGREEVLADLVRGGNELANHGMYDEPSKKLRDDVLVQQIGAVEEKIRAVYTAAAAAAAGVLQEPTPPPPPPPPPKYFRPGSGFFSDRMRAVLRKLGYRLVLGGIYPHDAQIPFWRVNAAHVLSMLRPGGIIICHDGRAWTVPMLRKVLPEIKRRGYRVVTVTKLLREAGA